MSSLISKKLKLFSNCIPVKGVERSIIYDLQRGSYQFIPNSLFELLQKYDGKTIETVKAGYDNKYDEIIDEYVSFLIDNEFAFFTSEPDSFPKLNLDWDSSSIISNAIICISKRKAFVFDKLINQLNQLNCKAVQLRFYDSFSSDELVELLQLFDNSRISSIELIIKFHSDFKTNSFLDKFQQISRLNKILIYCAPNNNVDFFGQKKTFIVQKVIGSLEIGNACAAIHPNSFVQNIPLFTEAQHFNTCLNRKIVIDEHGAIKNCPSMHESFGNVNSDDIKTVIESSAFQKKWHIKKDDIEVCQDCEFRYMCLDCRANLNENCILKQPLKCNYNPYIAKWKGQEGYVSVEKWSKSNMNN